MYLINRSNLTRRHCRHQSFDRNICLHVAQMESLFVVQFLFKSPNLKRTLNIPALYYFQTNVVTKQFPVFFTLEVGIDAWLRLEQSFKVLRKPIVKFAEQNLFLAVKPEMLLLSHELALHHNKFFVALVYFSWQTVLQVHVPIVNFVEIKEGRHSWVFVNADVLRLLKGHCVVGLHHPLAKAFRLRLLHTHLFWFAEA